MKYLILIAVILVVAWYWRNARRADAPPRNPSAPPGPPQDKVQDMVQCPVCLVRLPRSDALPGPEGQLYCCAEHRASGR
ncbi:MAG: PP0621 family protein [Ramlibacter sp.]